MSMREKVSKLEENNIGAERFTTKERLNALPNVNIYQKDFKSSSHQDSCSDRVLKEFYFYLKRAVKGKPFFKEDFFYEELTKFIQLYYSGG